jgi:predicted lipid carrier protein YhbT
VTTTRVATTTEVESKLEELIARLSDDADAAGELGRSLPDRRVLSVRVTDLDAEWWTELAGGRMGDLRRGSPDHADITIRAGSDDLVSLIDGRGSLFSAYLAGRIRVEASFSDLLRLRKLAS